MFNLYLDKILVSLFSIFRTRLHAVWWWVCVGAVYSSASPSL